MSPFSTVLIANRGEIAVRIARTARAMGLRIVAVYSDADAGAPHVHAADRAIRIGPAPAAQSYLDGRKLIAAARATGADAIHPGYGFLAENPEFAAACAADHLTFIGPSPAAIRAMGDKAAAKRIMTAKGVPCLPGFDGDAQDDATLEAEVDRIGYPVMLKATAGGGGKGMRLIESHRQLNEGLAAARSEAEKAFGSGRLMIEKAILAPRHVEVQIFGDTHGNVVHLGDRDCSIQRRHQKIVEEAPAPGLDAGVRRAMAAAARTAAQAIGYSGAGTVEFLLAEDGAFYFLEMNTRLQVEHPVTEMITGLDLVEWQFRVAAGEPLPLAQDEIVPRGHAIEVRLCAEDPQSDFLPQAGRIAAWHPPAGGGVRVDHALAPDTNVSTFYDSMLAKVIAHGNDREQARRRALRAVDDIFVAGIKTNQALLARCLASAEFRAGKLHTAFLDRYLGEPAGARPPDDGLVALAAALFYHQTARDHVPSLAGWRSSPWGGEPLTLTSGEWSGQVQVTCRSANDFSVDCGRGARSLLLVETSTGLHAVLDGIEDGVRFAWHDGVLTLLWRGICRSFAEQTTRADRSDAEENNLMARAPMPGVIARLHAADGDAVRKGDVLLVLEAMKMEHLIRAPATGTVASMKAVPGQQVANRQVLAEIAPSS